MFKIDQYVTPLILKYVDKYVKNIRPQDAQVSLWGGDVCFQNLDMKLDVLEDELQLPFNFLSGHIHELSIHVPWTALQSEPIKITINTIEFVLKLNTEPSESRRGSLKESVVKKKPSTEEVPGYIATLMNKIANNIQVTCHNIILKYIEEDIVVSMNIQHLSLSSANEMWQPAFIDVSPTKVLLRKVVDINDLTICLDKRNAAGKIEVCQEPILYRCSLQFRIIRRYNAATKDTACVTRIDMFTKFMEMSVSSLQLPMLVRLFDLGLALKLGKIRSETDIGAQSDELVDNVDTSQESYASWIWNNVVPSIFPDDEPDHERGTDTSGLVLHFGYYIESFKIEFKIVEFIGEQIVSKTKKIRYLPVLKIHLDRAYMDAIMCGLKWFNYKGGVLAISAEFLGDCPCGSKKTIAEVFSSRQVPISDITNYLKDTLMDDESVENDGKLRNYNTNWNNHFIYVNEEGMKAKTPAMSFDIVHFVDVPSDQSTSEIGSDLEYSNFSENYLLRLFIGGFKLNLGSDFFHRLDALVSYARAMEYPPYYLEKARLSFSQLPSCSTEDYDALMMEIPLREIQITVIDASVDLHFWDHEKTNLKLRKRHSSVAVPIVPSIICVGLEHLEFQIVSPLYPNRLIFTTCQLPEPPSNLFDKCFLKTECNMRKFSIAVRDPVAESNEYLMLPTNINFKTRQLLLPELWSFQTSLIRSEYLLEVNTASFSITAFELSTAVLLLQSLRHRKCVQLSPATEKTVHIDIELEKVVLRNVQTFESNFGSVSVSCACGTIGRKASDKKNLLFMWPHNLTNERLSIDSPPFLTITGQLPITVDNEPVGPSFLDVKIAEGCLNLDLLVFEFQKQAIHEITVDQKVTVHKFKHQESISEINVESPKRIYSSEKSTGRKSNNMATIPSIHSSSSEKDLAIVEVAETAEEDEVEVNATGVEKMPLVSFYLLVKNLILNIHVERITVFHFEKVIISSSINELMANSADKSRNILTIELPALTVNSSLNRAPPPTNSGNTNFMSSVQPTQHKVDSFPWKISFKNLAIRSVCEHCENEILAPISTNITVAVSVKDEPDQPAEMSLNFHIDNTPIQVNLIAEQIGFLHSLFATFQAAIPANPTRSAALLEKLEIFEKSSQNQLQIDQQTEVREFLAMTTTTKDDDKQPSQKQVALKSSELSLWMQWTISKVSVHLLTADRLEKFITDFEDIIFSLDKQDLYFKLKTKVATMSGQYFSKANEVEGWQKAESFRFATAASLVDDSTAAGAENDFFLDLTLTKAETANVHSKWGTFKHQQSLNPTLTEVVVKLQHVDATVDMDLMTRLTKSMRRPACNRSEPSPEPIKTLSNDNVKCVATLPLVHLESRGLRLFLPVADCPTTDCSVYIVKVNRISLVPTVENPINRNQLRPDIYAKAAQLRLINLAGSKVEDRQYEFGLKSISLSTANWTEVVRYFQNDDNAINHKNPAFEWNNAEQTDETLNNFNILTILKDFNFSFIYAPPIVLRNVVVCGEAVELNCFTDLSCEIDTKQIELARSLGEKLTRFLPMSTSSREKSMYVKVNGAIFRQSSDSSCSHNEKDSEGQSTVRQLGLKRSHSLVDSGLESSVDGFGTSASQSTRKVRSKSLHKPISPASSVYTGSDLHVPYEMTVISGISTFKVYQVGPNGRKPLFYVILTQPNLLVSYGLSEKSIHFSIFDFKLALGLPNDDFKDTLFATKAGEPNAHGIVQPWLQIKHKKTLLTMSDSLQVDIKRPMQFCVSDKKLKRILDLKLLLDDIMAIGDVHEGGAIYSGNRYTRMRKLFGKLASVHVTCGQAVLEVMNEERHNFKASVDSFEGAVRVTDRPEKISMDLKLKNVLLSDQKAVILHPLTLSVVTTLANEYWKRTPLIFVYINASVLEVDVNPMFLRNLSDVHMVFAHVLGEYSDLVELQAASRRVVAGTGMVGKELIPISVPKYQEKSSAREEHYQDDLRAGAFQFIETFSGTEHPLPYQIQIINKELGIVCWRYPQPRSLSRVQVFPVPINAHKMTSINCHIEYYSDLHKEFRKFCNFSISDNETKSLELPVRKIAASMWRTVMTDYVSSEEEINDDKDNDDQAGPFRLNPKILIACLRIDSFFVASNIPHLEWKLQFDKVQLNLSNACPGADGKVPDILRLYDMNHDMPRFYRFMAGTFRNLQMNGCLYDNLEAILNVDFGCGLEILDHSCLSNQKLVETFEVKTMLELRKEQLLVNAMTETVQVNYGPSVGQTLAVAERLWHDCMAGREDREHVLVTKFVICNNTPNYFHVRQWTDQGADIADGINLKPMSFSAYPFPKMGRQVQQHLQFSCQESSWEFSPPILISGGTTTKFVRFSNGLHLTVAVESISATQHLIKLSGLVEFHNRTSLAFYVQYKTQVSADEIHEQLLKLPKHSSSSLFCTSSASIQQSMRLKLTSNVGGKGWSGEIPLKEIIPNNRPWLVKVPSTINKDYCSFWVRILREDFGDCGQQRVLVVVWPLFMVQSHLSCDTRAQEAGSGRHYEVVGRGSKRDVYLTGTHEDDHRLNFNHPLIEDAKREVLISYNLIDKKQFFCIPEPLTGIDRALESLAKCEENRWPCSGREEEQRWERPSEEQAPITPIFSFSKDHELSCALKLSVATTLFVNSIGLPVRLVKAPKTMNGRDLPTCIVAPNNIVMPFHIDDYFALQVKIGDTWIGEHVICLNNEKPPTVFTSVHLPTEGSTPLCMPTDDGGVVRLILSSVNENNLRTLVLSSAFVVSNHIADLSLQCWALCLPKNEKKVTPQFRLATAKSECVYRVDANSKGGKNAQGVAISVFQTIMTDKRPRKSKAKQEYNFFLVFFDETKEEMSRAVLLNNNRTKNSLNIALPDRCVPVAASTILHQDQHFVTLYMDNIPLMLIENATDFSICVAQSQTPQTTTKAGASPAPNESNTVILIPEIADDLLIWHQVIAARATIYYTPPALDDAFPDCMQSTIDFGLTFACHSGNSNIRWSQPIKIDKTKEIFFNVPLYGALRLAIDMEGETVHLVLDYVSQNLVFSAQDIRTRLSQPSPIASEVKEDVDGPQSLVVVASGPQIGSLSKAANASVAGVWLNYLTLNLHSHGLKVVLFKDCEPQSSKKEKIVAINMDVIEVRMTGKDRQVRLSVSNIQVDNQLYRAGGAYDFPVILCGSQDQQLEFAEPRLSLTSSLHDLDKLLDTAKSEPIFAVTLHFYKTSDCNVESVHLKISPIRAYIEDTYINLLLDFLVESLPGPNLIHQSASPIARVTCRPGCVLLPDTVIQQAKYFAMPLRMRHLRIEPINVLLSVHTCMRLYIALDHSPLYFSAYERANFNTLPLKLGNTLGMQYLSRAIFGAGWVIGSLEILGSPSGLARSFSSGLRDFVSMPLQGLFRGPWGFLMGVTQGSTSLVRHIAAGTVNSVTKLATSVARNLDRLSLDSEHVERTDAARRNLPLGLSDALSSGLTSFGISILSAVGGLAHHSLQATSTAGVVAGMGKGIVGALTKPISGAAELLALTGQGVLQSVGYNTLPISRLAIMSREPEVGPEPSVAKLIWNYVPEMFRAECVLFAAVATQLTSTSDRKAVMLGLLSKMFIVVDLSTETTTEIWTLDRIQPGVVATKPNVLTIKVRDSKSTSPSPTRLADQHSNDRIFQYVQQSALYASLSASSFSQQFYETKSLTFPETGDENDDNEGASLNDSHVFHLADATTVQYLFDYLGLAKSTTSIRTNKFSVYDA